jgi:hypothetical protein
MPSLDNDLTQSEKRGGDLMLHIVLCQDRKQKQMILICADVAMK